MSRFFFWNRIPLRVQGLIFNSLPLIAVLLTAAFAFFSNQQREKMEISVNRHFEMVENLVDLQMSLVNAESGLRGFLLTHDADFLQPYEEMRELIPQKLDRIKRVIYSISRPSRRVDRLARLDAVQKQLESQMAVLASLADAAKASPKDHTTQELKAQFLGVQSQRKVAELRLAHLRADEQRMLSKRLDDTRSARQRDFLLIFLSVGVGLATRAVALYFFHRRVVRRVRQLTENIRSLRDGSSLVHEPSGHRDEIGELERELALIGDYLAEQRSRP